MEFKENDGGRKEAGFKGDAGDCVTRAIAIATGIPYITVYDTLHAKNKEFATNSHSRAAKKVRAKGSTPRDGVFKSVYHPWLLSLGWKWIPTMQIGQGCKVHLNKKELPSGTLIVQVSKHITTVIDGVIHDTFDCSRGESRCVYGYYKFEGKIPEQPKFEEITLITILNEKFVGKAILVGGIKKTIKELEFDSDEFSRLVIRFFDDEGVVLEANYDTKIKLLA